MRFYVKNNRVPRVPEAWRSSNNSLQELGNGQSIAQPRVVAKNFKAFLVQQARLFQLVSEKSPSSSPAGPPPITPRDQPHRTLSLCFLLPPPQGLCFGKGEVSQVQSGGGDRGVTWDDGLSDGGMWPCQTMHACCFEEGMIRYVWALNSSARTHTHTHTHTDLHTTLRTGSKLWKIIYWFQIFNGNNFLLCLLIWCSSTVPL